MSLNSKDVVSLTTEQAEELNQDEMNYFNSNKDANPIEIDTIYPCIAEVAVVSGKKDAKDFLSDLGETLEALRITLKQEDLLILPDWRFPWLDKGINYPPVQAAQNYLRKQINTDFVGGFQLNNTQLVDFIPHLFWLISTNSVSSDILMSFEQSSTVLSICKHGSIHLDFYDEVEQKVILSFFKNKGFIEIEHCEDIVDFESGVK